MNRKQIGLVAGFLGGALIAPTQSEATNILTFGLPGRADQYNWQAFITDSYNTGVHSISMLNSFSYYTPTGFTGTLRDQFQFSVRFTPGFVSPVRNGPQTGLGISAPSLSMQYYYNVVEPKIKDRSDPQYFIWWTNPQITLNFPNGNTLPRGFGSGANQFSINVNDNNYFQFGKVAFSINPISATFGFRNLDPTQGATRTIQNGLSLSIADTAIGYFVTPDLVLGVQGQYLLNNIAYSDNLTSRVARLGPALTYLGFKDDGFFIAFNYNKDVYAHNPTNTLKRGNLYQLWLEKYF